MINKIIEINNKWRKKYNTIYVKYAALADKQISELEEDRNILMENIKYRNNILELKEELKKYKRKYGRLNGGDKNVKNKNKGQNKLPRK